MMNKFIAARKNTGITVYQIKGHTDEVFDKLQYPSGCVEFKYHKADPFFIPALNLSRMGNFTPVFFNIDVLLNYIHNPKYKIELGAETFGNISTEEFSIPFGINRSGKVIMWLIDIVNLPDEEQYYLRSKNIDSDHDVGSEFYEAQFECVWAEPSREQDIIGHKGILDKIVKNINGFNLYNLSEEASDVVKHWTRPILYSDKEIAESFETINKVLVETLNVQELKDYILKHTTYVKKELSTLKGMKLLRLWLINFTNILEDEADELLLPLFVLYDLRIVYAHLSSIETKEESFVFICNRLQLATDCRDNEVIYNTIIDKILEMFKKLISNINAVSKDVPQ
jgi:hypothetical protein